jgi:hypothetical protein
VTGVWDVRFWPIEAIFSAGDPRRVIRSKQHHKQAPATMLLPKLASEWQ